LHGTGCVAGSERRVRSARVLSLVEGRDGLDEQGAVPTDPDVSSVLDVHQTSVLGPDDHAVRRVGLDEAVDAAEQTARQVEPLRHVHDARSICDHHRHTTPLTPRKAPLTRYNLLSDRLLYRVYKHSTGCQTRLTTGLTTGYIVYTAGCQCGCTTRFNNRLNEQWLFVQHGIPNI